MALATSTIDPSGLPPHVRLMHDPRTPEIIAWLESLPARDRLATMHAMAIAFPVVRKSADWKAQLGVLRAALNPTAEELGEILVEAGRISLRLKHEFPT